MKYLLCVLAVLVSVGAYAEKKKKCKGALKLKVGETYVDERTQTSYRCDCKPGTGITDSTGTSDKECVPILFSRRIKPGALQDDYRPVGIYKSARGE